LRILFIEGQGKSGTNDREATSTQIRFENLELSGGYITCHYTTSNQTSGTYYEYNNYGAGAAVFVLNANLTLGPGTVITNNKGTLGGAITVERYAASHAATSNVMATLTMKPGSRIVGNTSTKAGAVMVRGNEDAPYAPSYFYMEGGEISNNVCISTISDANPWPTGGIRVQYGGYFEMTGGEITDNTRGASATISNVRRGYNINHRVIIGSPPIYNYTSTPLCHITANISIP
jgi:hypothetical protein